MTTSILEILSKALVGKNVSLKSWRPDHFRIGKVKAIHYNAANFRDVNEKDAFFTFQFEDGSRCDINDIEFGKIEILG